MDRLILTMVPECEEHLDVAPFLHSYELSPRCKYEVWFDTETNKWTLCDITRKIERNNRACEGH